MNSANRSLVLAVLKSKNLYKLKKALSEQSRPFSFSELQREYSRGIPLSRVAISILPGDSLPNFDFDLKVESKLEIPRYCPYCIEEEAFTSLLKRNTYGVCRKHQDKLPHRRERKRKK